MSALVLLWAVVALLLALVVLGRGGFTVQMLLIVAFMVALFNTSDRLNTRD